MDAFPSIKRFKKWNLPMKTSYVFCWFSMIMAITMVIIINLRKDNTNINSKINELENIRIALNTLDNYVSSQQKGLKKLSNEIQKLEVEKESISSILQIEKDKLESFLVYQNKIEKKNMWWNMAISFLIGVLSSSIVTIIAMRFQKRVNQTNGNAVEVKNITE